MNPIPFPDVPSNGHQRKGVGSSHAKEDSQHTNLELWSTSQPAGQRVEDKLRWAEELIAEYQPIVKRLRKVQK